eukprot:2929777-Prymnesium_polylepis.1
MGCLRGYGAPMSGRPKGQGECRACGVGDQDEGEHQGGEWANDDEAHGEQVGKQLIPSRWPRLCLWRIATARSRRRRPRERGGADGDAKGHRQQPHPPRRREHCRGDRRRGGGTHE